MIVLLVVEPQGDVFWIWRCDVIRDDCGAWMTDDVCKRTVRVRKTNLSTSSRSRPLTILKRHVCDDHRKTVHPLFLRLSLCRPGTHSKFISYVI